MFQEDMEFLQRFLKCAWLYTGEIDSHGTDQAGGMLPGQAGTNSHRLSRAEKAKEGLLQVPYYDSGLGIS